MRWCPGLMMIGSVVLLAAGSAAPAAQKNGDDKENMLVVVDFNGKDHKFKTWKFTKGTKPLSWLATIAPEAKDKDKEKGKGKKPVVEGPEALEFVESKLPPLKKGVLTYIPLASVRSIEFDVGKDKDTMRVRVARSDKEADDEVLVGPTGYIGMNHVAFSAVADLGELGQATVEFQGGVERGVKSMRFTSPKPIEAPGDGRVAVVTQTSKKYPTLKVVDVQALYQQAGGQLKTLPTLYFKDNLKIDFTKITSLAQVGNSGANFDVALLSGQQVPLVLVNRPKGADGKSDLQLVGLLGRFAAGYRLFPMATVGELHFEEKEKK